LREIIAQCCAVLLRRRLREVDQGCRRRRTIAATAWPAVDHCGGLILYQTRNNFLANLSHCHKVQKRNGLAILGNDRLWRPAISPVEQDRCRGDPNSFIAGLQSLGECGDSRRSVLLRECLNVTRNFRSTPRIGAYAFHKRLADSPRYWFAALSIF
jgi:hypothetical protein